jgi:hypothetical protein
MKWLKAAIVGALAGLIMFILLAVAILRGVGLALVLWLILMLIYSPVIGWGIFGFGGPNHELPSQAPLYIRAAGPYVAGTLLLHAIYGLILGWLDSRWINFSREAESS